MSRNILYAALASIALALGAVAEERVTSTFTQIDYPGAAVTVAFGTNAHADIVGFYVDKTGNVHGFLQSDGDFSPINYPGALVTQARGINNEGDIVGTYQVNPGAPGGGFHGFLLHQGVFKSVDFPGHLNTMAQRITDARQILGCYHDQDFMGTMHGMIVNDNDYDALDGSYYSLNVPASMNNGATPEAGIITGFYTDMMNHTHGYLIRHGNFAPFDFPGSLSTQPWDMNARSEVVGVYSDAAGKTHGFLLNHRDRECTSCDAEADQGRDSEWWEHAFVSIDYPGAMATRAFGINSRGDVVGLFADTAGNVHAFLLSRARHDAD